MECTRTPRATSSLVALLVTLITLCSARRAHAQSKELVRNHVDAQELRNEQVLRPRVALFIEQGETALAAGRLQQAVDHFQQAVDGSPHSALPRRRLCIALAALGRRSEAIQACQVAAANLGSGMDFRALVGALMSAPPSPAELAAALGYAQRAVKVMGQEPWGYAAQCDIMRRLGDWDMLTKCLEDLQRVAPDHYETREVAHVVSSLRSPVRFALGWGALALVVVGTAVHALRSRLHRASAVTAALLTALIVGAPSYARADDEGKAPVAGSLSKYQVDDVNPSASVPSPELRDRNPLEYGYFLMDLADRAAKASERGDDSAAARYWMALYKAVPDRSVSLSKACVSYEAAGDLPSALAACKLALQKDGVLVNDYARFVNVSLKKVGPLDAQELADIDTVLKHLSATDAEQLVGHELNCNVAMKQNDVERLQACSAALAARVPGHPQTLYYQWALALLEGDNTAARRFIEQAKVAGASPQRIEEMTRTTAERGSVWRRFGQQRLLIAGLALLLAALAIIAVRALRNRSAPQTA